MALFNRHDPGKTLEQLQEQAEQEVKAEEVEIQLGDYVLPVPHNSMKITKAAVFDEQEIENRTGKVKFPVGYDDAQIAITLQLVPERQSGVITKTAQARLEELFSIFKPEEEAVPVPYPIVSSLTEAYRISRVVILDIEAKETSRWDMIAVTLHLKEFESVENQLQRIKDEGAALTQEEQVAISDTQQQLMGEQDVAAEALEQGFQDGHEGTGIDMPGADSE